MTLHEFFGLVGFAIGGWIIFMAWRITGHTARGGESSRWRPRP